MKNTQKYKKLLKSRLGELESLMEDSAGSSKPVALDQQAVGRISRGDALMQQAMAVEVKQRRVDELVRIKSALTRSESDDYGYCVKCDGQIPDARLDLDPSVALCVNCAR